MTAARGSAPRTARLDADSTRGDHMRKILVGRLAVYCLAIGVVGTVLLGAWLRQPIVMLAGPLVVAALVVVFCLLVADQLAEAEFFRSFAQARGLTYARRMELLPLTPLLGAGDRRECRHWMQGPLGEGLPGGGLGQYVFKVRKGSGESETWTSHDFTICVADLEPGIVLYPGVFLTRRRDLVERFGGGRWLDTGNRREVELESEVLHERCELWVERSQDDLRLLQLFSPSFVSWLAEHPLQPCFEYRAGTLVVYLERRLEDAGRLGWMLDATAEIARRVQREVVQAAGTRAA
jgi:hypothetical protein